MIRTILVTLLLCVAALYLPLWFQLPLYFLAAFATAQRLTLFVPAILSDVLYGTTGGIGSIKTTLFVAALLILCWLLFNKTRFGEMIYGVES